MLFYYFLIVRLVLPLSADRGSFCFIKVYLDL
nr:MAG TPA: hypothetical protein [Caudoviricetes sp.]